MATLPNASVGDMQAALTPFYNTLARLNISLSLNETALHPSYLAHIDAYGTNDNETRNMTIGSRLIPRPRCCKSPSHHRSFSQHRRREHRGRFPVRRDEQQCLAHQL